MQRSDTSAAATRGGRVAADRIVNRSWDSAERSASAAGKRSQSSPQNYQTAHFRELRPESRPPAAASAYGGGHGGGGGLTPTPPDERGGRDGGRDARQQQGRKRGGYPEKGRGVNSEERKVVGTGREMEERGGRRRGFDGNRQDAQEELWRRKEEREGEEGEVGKRGQKHEQRGYQSTNYSFDNGGRDRDRANVGGVFEEKGYRRNGTSYPPSSPPFTSFNQQGYDEGQIGDIPADSISDRIRNLEQKLQDMKDWRTETPEELGAASDLLEFQEDDILEMQAAVRSTRAELASLEGRMATEIREAWRLLDEKEKQLEDMELAIGELRSVRIVWPSPAIDVELAGSFNGWTQRFKMKKSEDGVFSVTLQLYPGRYEMKFIVDGHWRIDRCRPISYIGGHENNSLTVI
ncbi:hypothetical protein CBR_g23347 [Chara braunii]|uniref:AMP-activated protein kinase glycogen-binding domain-containing protein n=1 Tax=Chara braunii TaxID=69332 RepID=A0A388L3Y8_CHABU|nr:hypothetical protein CBR_g23347 [Chara braunii]|eukprot:GBG77020.1 hypothetical protein CBR_g23347 [Chara braunii]